VLEPGGSRHLVAVARDLHAVHDRHVGCFGGDVLERLAEEASAQPLVVYAGGSEEPVEGAPVVVGEAEGEEGLGDGAPGKAGEVAHKEGLRPEEGALLPKGGSVGRKQAPQRIEQRRFGGGASEGLVCSVMGLASVGFFGFGS
jgi:hypothetical protein